MPALGKAPGSTYFLMDPPSPLPWPPAAPGRSTISLRGQGAAVLPGLRPGTTSHPVNTAGGIKPSSHPRRSMLRINPKVLLILCRVRADSTKVSRQTTI